MSELYRVVVNHEEQYSIWPADRAVPDGWRPEGTTGAKDECLSHIDVVWTDMRPLSLRRHMDGQPAGVGTGEAT
jgi:MbtH protein